MIKIGLTGNIAAGKSFVRNIFSNIGIKTFCADSVVQKILSDDEKTIQKIMECFGDEIIDENKKLDKKKIGNIVFYDEKKKKQLEKIIHPIVIKCIKEFLEKNKKEKFVIVDIPLLFECNLEKLFDKIILVYASDKTRIERIKKRNNFDEKYIKKIMENQLNQEIKKEKSDFVIINESKTKKEIEKEIKNFLRDLS